MKPFRVSDENVADLKMPGGDVIDRMCMEVAKKLAADQDALIRACINQYFMHGPWNMSDVIPRLRCEVDTVNPNAPKVFFIDDTPLIEIWPPESEPRQEGASTYLKWTVKYRKLI